MRLPVILGLARLDRADREQFSPKERERIGDCLSEESAAGKNGVREINAA